MQWSYCCAGPKVDSDARRSHCPRPRLREPTLHSARRAVGRRSGRRGLAGGPPGGSRWLPLAGGRCGAADAPPRRPAGCRGGRRRGAPDEASLPPGPARGAHPAQRRRLPGGGRRQPAVRDTAGSRRARGRPARRRLPQHGRRPGVGAYQAGGDSGAGGDRAGAPGRGGGARHPHERQPRADLPRGDRCGDGRIDAADQTAGAATADVPDALRPAAAGPRDRAFGREAAGGRHGEERPAGRGDRRSEERPPRQAGRGAAARRPERRRGGLATGR